jgi:hypothetical protein
VEILTSLGIQIDTSIIPGIDWSSTGINDFTFAPLKPCSLRREDLCLPGSSGLLKDPCTLKPGMRLFGLGKNRYVAAIFRRIGIGNKWLRVSPQVSAKKIAGSLCMGEQSFAAVEFNIPFIRVYGRGFSILVDGSRRCSTF